ncbi:MAG: YraN family protein [Candidatus Vogelbacteria bacterium]|nr:YraN family protein [Candidatus Vogelbacteria bacterium]
MFDLSDKEIGKRGENIACSHYRALGNTICTQNFSRKYGEIDIVAIKGNLLRFIEVKTSFRKNCDALTPDVRIDYKKRRNLPRIIDAYLSENNVPENVLYQIDIAIVYLSDDNGESTVELLENVEL